MALQIAQERQASTAVTVFVAGEVDVSCADELRGALDDALASAAEEVIVDISELSYIDSTGIGVLVGVVHRGEEQGKRVRIAHPQRNVERVLAMLGILADLGIDEQGR